MASHVGQYVTGELRGIPKLVIVWYRQNHQDNCFYCGLILDLSNRTRDHVVPRCNGHRINNNIVPACKNCNRSKGCLNVRQFRAKLGPWFWGEVRFINSKSYEKALKSAKKSLDKHVEV